MRLRQRPLAGLDHRLLAIDDAIAAGDGVVDDELLRSARRLIERAGERLGHGVDRTVVALAGATGSGKSSLFNALVGGPVSEVGVRRPTTSRTSAAAWGEGADALLDWLHVPGRHHVPVGDHDPLRGLVLLDLPDHDSTALDHRAEVDRVVAVADMVAWVLDPQKYADGAVHERYLRPLASHASVLLVVLNQADRLDDGALTACRADLARLLADDGLGQVDVLSTSALTGAGVEELRAELGRRVTEREAAVERIAADVSDVASALAGACSPGAGAAPRRAPRNRTVEAMAEAAGLRTISDAVARSHQSRAGRQVGWPPTRWVRRLRPDPLRRLHLEPDTGSTARTSLPAPTEVSLARLATAVRDLTDDVGRDLPQDWSDALRAGGLARLESLPDRLDAAVGGTALGTGDTPRWWSVTGALQRLLVLVAGVGALWLAVLAVLGYLQLGSLGDLGTPNVGTIPLPTALLLGGAVGGLVLAVLARPFVAVGARRRARRAERRIRDRLEELADEALLGPAAALVERHQAFCDAVRRAGTP
jgi:GTP-binding protein EngB required for normal cell division